MVAPSPLLGSELQHTGLDVSGGGGGGKYDKIN